jgi:hypothetical protein
VRHADRPRSGDGGTEAGKSAADGEDHHGRGTLAHDRDEEVPV